MVDLKNCHLTSDQSQQFLTAITEPSCRITDLSMQFVKTWGLTSSVLGPAVARLVRVNLCGIHWSMTGNWSTELLTATLSSTTLAHLDLSHNDLSDVPGDILAAAVGRLVTADLRYTNLTPGQVVDILTKIPTSDTLTKVFLGHADMSRVPEHVLGQAAAHLMELSLRNCKLTQEQYLALMASGRWINFQLN